MNEFDTKLKQNVECTAWRDAVGWGRIFHFPVITRNVSSTFLPAKTSVSCVEVSPAWLTWKQSQPSCLPGQHLTSLRKISDKDCKTYFWKILTRWELSGLSYIITKLWVWVWLRYKWQHDLSLCDIVWLSAWSHWVTSYHDRNMNAGLVKPTGRDYFCHSNTFYIFFFAVCNFVCSQGRSIKNNQTTSRLSHAII